MIPAFPAPPLPFPPLWPGFALPVGCLVAFAGEVAWPGQGSSTDPDHSTPIETSGWMLCDGRTLKISDYPELFAALGYRYSPTGGGDTFSIPDLRGYFLRGTDPRGADQGGNDPDAGERTMMDGTTSPAVGSRQDCAFQLHEHDYSQAEAQSAPSSGGNAGVVTELSAATSKIVPDPAGTTPLTSRAETRPKNISVHYLIRFTCGANPLMALLPGFRG